MKRKQPHASDPIGVAARALRHRDRSRRQIEERLARAGVEDDRRADALDALERIGYVDDARFAEGLRAGRGRGGRGKVCDGGVRGVEFAVLIAEH
jgi:SOS response regulatory protein OraA/RecX